MKKIFIILVSVFSVIIASSIDVAAASYEPEQLTMLSDKCEAVFEDISIPAGADRNLLCYAGGKIIYSVTHDNGGTSEQHLYYIEDSGNIQNKKHFFKTDRQKSDILSFCSNKTAGIYIIMLETDGDKENISLKSVSWDGKVKEINYLNDFCKGEEDNCYHWKMDANPDGTVIVYSSLAYRVINSAGTILKEGTFSKPDLYDINFYQNDRVLFTHYNYGAREISLISKEKEIKLTGLPLYTENYQMLNESENSILVRTDWKLYRFYPAENKLEAIWNWSDFGIEGEKILQIYLSECGNLEAIILDNNKIQKAVWKNTQTETKEQIILGCIGENEYLYKAVAQYNAQHDDYAIIVKNYESQDTITPCSHMTSDIQAGTGPDIIAADPQNIDYVRLGEKGILEDLTSYLAESGSIDGDDFVPSIYQALKTGGKLYMLPTNFSISFISTNKHFVEETAGFSLSGIKKVLSENPGLHVGIGKKQLLDLCFEYDMYPDIFDNKLPFDENKFENYLNLANQLHEEPYYVTDESLYKDDKVLFEPTTIYEVNDYLYYKNLWGDSFQSVGYPEADGNGVLIMPGNCWGINAQSKHKEIAWKFIESFFASEEPGKHYPSWPFPIVEKLFVRQLDEGARKQLYTDIDGNTAEYPRISYEYNDSMINIYSATPEDLKEIRELVSGAKIINRRHDRLRSLIQEETDAYFSGQKNAEEVSSAVHKIITSYLLENE